MNFMKVLDIMKEYNISVLIMAFIICGLVALIKKLAPNFKKKFLTFVPFVFGIILYAVYILITEGAAEILKPDTLISGFECGGAATIYYIIYEQFIRNRKLLDISSKEELLITGILNNIIKPELLEETSKRISEAFKGGLAEPELIKACAEIIKANAELQLSANEIKMLVKLIIEAQNPILGIKV